MDLVKSIVAVSVITALMLALAMAACFPGWFVGRMCGGGGVVVEVSGLLAGPRRRIGIWILSCIAWGASFSTLIKDPDLVALLLFLPAMLAAQTTAFFVGYTPARERRRRRLAANEAAAGIPVGPTASVERPSKIDYVLAEPQDEFESARPIGDR